MDVNFQDFQHELKGWRPFINRCLKKKTNTYSDELEEILLDINSDYQRNGEYAPTSRMVKKSVKRFLSKKKKSNFFS